MGANTSQTNDKQIINNNDYNMIKLKDIKKGPLFSKPNNNDWGKEIKKVLSYVTNDLIKIIIEYLNKPEYSILFTYDGVKRINEGTRRKIIRNTYTKISWFCSLNKINGFIYYLKTDTNISIYKTLNIDLINGFNILYGKESSLNFDKLNENPFDEQCNTKTHDVVFLEDCYDYLFHKHKKFKKKRIILESLNNIPKKTIIVLRPYTDKKLIILEKKEKNSLVDLRDLIDHLFYIIKNNQSIEIK